MIAVIAAMGENRVIGFENKIPWKLPNDMKRFKELTSGHPVVMGRKTFESIGKPLPQRTNIVLTRSKPAFDSALALCTISNSFPEALEAAKSSPGSERIFVLGGSEIYKIALENPEVTHIFKTYVHGFFEGDAFFPQFDTMKWGVINFEEHKKDEKNPYDYDYFDLVRI